MRLAESLTKCHQFSHRFVCQYPLESKNLLAQYEFARTPT
jgi:hypothetical protein